MPIYEFKCLDNHVTEVIYLTHDLDFTATHICGRIGCNKIGERIWSLPANHQIAPPINYFKNPKTGEVRTASSSNETAPKGFVKQEAKGQQERLKLEKRLNFDQSIENEITSDRYGEAKERSRKSRHADNRAMMGSLDSHSQHLVKAAMERTNNKKQRRKKTEVRIAVNNTNASNLNK